MLYLSVAGPNFPWFIRLHAQVSYEDSFYILGGSYRKADEDQADGSDCEETDSSKKHVYR